MSRIKVKVCENGATIHKMLMHLHSKKYRIVSDVLYQIMSILGETITAEKSIVLSIDGYQLQPFEVIDILKDNDIIKVNLVAVCNDKIVSASKAKKERIIKQPLSNEESIMKNSSKHSDVKRKYASVESPNDSASADIAVVKKSHTSGGKTNGDNVVSGSKPKQLPTPIPTISSQPAPIPPIVDVGDLWAKMNSSSGGSSCSGGVPVPVLNLAPKRRQPQNNAELLFRCGERQQVVQSVATAVQVSGPDQRHNSSRPSETASNSANTLPVTAAPHPHRVDEKQQQQQQQQRVKVTYNSLPTVKISSEVRAGDVLAFKYWRLCDTLRLPVESDFVKARCLSIESKPPQTMPATSTAVSKVTRGSRGRKNVAPIPPLPTQPPPAVLSLFVLKTDLRDDSYAVGETVLLAWNLLLDVKVVERAEEVQVAEKSKSDRDFSVQTETPLLCVVGVSDSNTVTVHAEDEFTVADNEIEESQGFGLLDLFAADLESKKHRLMVNK